MILELGLAFEKFPAPKISAIYEEKAIIFEKVWKIALLLATGPGHAQKWPKESSESLGLLLKNVGRPKLGGYRWKGGSFSKIHMGEL